MHTIEKIELLKNANFNFELLGDDTATFSCDFGDEDEADKYIAKIVASSKANIDTSALASYATDDDEESGENCWVVVDITVNYKENNLEDIKSLVAAIGAN